MDSPQRTVTFADSPVTVAPGDRVIFVDCVNGPVVLLIPTAASKFGRLFEIVKTDNTTNPAVITPTGGQLINGLATINVTERFQCVAFFSNGADYIVKYGLASASAGGDVVDAAGATVDAYATVVDITQPQGMVGIGTIVNTGFVNGLKVKETVVDKFGTTRSIETVVPLNDDYMLDIQTNFDDGVLTKARPPYTAYKVEVKSDVPGSPTTYDLRWIDVVPGSGGGGSGGGPPGTWVEVASGQTPIGPGATVTLASGPLPLGSAEVYVPYVVFDTPGGAPLALFQGNTLVNPPTNCVTYSLNFGGPGVELVARANASAPPCTLNWVLYKVVP